jgi:nicotinamide-nucleotide amidase
VNSSMKTASIISIGNELLCGRTVDTNASYLARELANLSIPVSRHYTVGDERDAIAETLKLALAHSEIIVVTGGLGPTDDDVTRHGLARFLGVELRLHLDQLDAIRAMFKRYHRIMPACNEVQARFPEGTEPMTNTQGTAPGISVRQGSKVIFVLPGIPKEMERMFQVSVLPALQKHRCHQAIVTRRLQCYGTGESRIAELLSELMRRERNPLINCTVHSGVITLHIVAKSDNIDGATQLADSDEHILRDKLGDFVFGCDDQTLADVIGATLLERGRTLALAESCTGGLLAKLVTDTPGSSRYFSQAWVTYCNGAKIAQLGVPKQLLDKHGAVSEPVAEAMAIGARRQSGTDYAIGITGIAGPGGGSEEKPVGLVFVGIDSDRGCNVKRFVFSRDRQYIRQRAAHEALYLLRQTLGFDFR